MKIDLSRFLNLLWMAGVGYLLYLLVADVHYIMELLHAYVSMAVGHLKP
tara:strand:+ start:1446 stop:1592 length:147 start_codon:yes stop_codon:yes gene_type:complete